MLSPSYPGLKSEEKEWFDSDPHPITQDNSFNEQSKRPIDHQEKATPMRITHYEGPKTLKLMGPLGICPGGNDFLRKRKCTEL